MANVVMESCPTVDANGNQDVKRSESAENFQKFMYELFEKNGVMNDLRSYLRGHIVNVIKSAQTGDSPPCQKHFTQRLELKFQALNILIAEYLLRLEFSYTLSVFISEIPLANMVFSYAKTLMEKIDNDDSRPRFKDNDVWCILNYLGVKCDSEHASTIVEMYKERECPLLLCILKSASLFREPVVMEQGNTSQDSLSSSLNSSGSEDRPSLKKSAFQQKCRHYLSCKTCQSRIARVKEKYRRKKKDITKNLNESSPNCFNVESLMKNIGLMERSLIDEMFEQLKDVYETEIELMKQAEDKRVRRSIAAHSTQLQKRREEMEESFKAREVELEQKIQQKKRFLWGLARALREQHQHMTRAMHQVRDETNRLSAKEDSLKTQLAEAEKILRERGEDMRQQISSELAVLEQHLESMKRERDTINRERHLLEQYKDKTATNTVESESVKSHYELLRNDFGILEKYLKTAKPEPQCVERSTLRDLSGVTSRIDVLLNNGQDVERVEERVKPKHLVNDLKKQKNVNFSQSNLDEVYRERSRSRSRSSASSEAGDAACYTESDAMQRLTDENEQLRCFARQQREHIDNLSSQQARLQAELTAMRMRVPLPAPLSPGVSPRPYPPQSPIIRPRTAPAVFHSLDRHIQRMNTSRSLNNFSNGWKIGAGEELSFFSDAQPRVVIPGDAIPFVGVVTRHTDNRRYLINQWRTLRRRISPLSGVCKRTTSPIHSREPPAGTSVDAHLDQNTVYNYTTKGTIPSPKSVPRASASDMKREKSPKSVLREAKENLRNKDTTTVKHCPPTKREKSPNSVLREAKQRLRKLEIEAEAVEKSYLDFRRKQDSFRDERRHPGNDKESSRSHIDTKPNSSVYKLNETYTKESTSHYQEPRSTSYDKYLEEYKTKYNIGETFYKNRNTATVRINPIPNACSSEVKKGDNYLETPLNEFRKFYRTDRLSDTPKSAEPSDSKSKGTRKEKIRLAKNDKVKELEILKHNIGKIYNMPEHAIVETPDASNNALEIKWTESKINLENQENILENDAVDMEYQISLHNDTNLEEAIADSERDMVEKGERDVVQNIRKDEIDDRNLLRIEVESIREINDVKVTESQTQDLLLVVESSVDNNRDGEISDNEFYKENISTQMTIIISPKITPRNELLEIVKTNEEIILDNNKSRREAFNSGHTRALESTKSSPRGHHENSVKSELVKFDITTNDLELNESAKSDTTKDILAIDHIENDRMDDVQMQLDYSKEVLDNTISELEQNEDPDYPDDFSADVDNYNSRSEYNNSPISLPKNSEDDNFWDN